MPEVKKYIPLNFALLANPVNWIIVILMVVLAGMFLAFIFSQNVTTEEN
jgi:hypothetical protein